jgi:phosphodiesterase/alkaline phosphatase D-like protein
MRRATLLGAVMALIAVPVVFVSQAAAAGSPSVTTGSASSITSSSATVSGTVNPNGDATMYAFQYGTTSGFGHETTLTSAGSGDTSSTVSASITGLTSGTTYHYRIIALNGSGTTTGADLTFKTTGTPPPPPATKPTSTTGTASASVNGATVNGTVNPNGLLTHYYFEFGTTSAYGLQTPTTSAGSGTVPVSVSRSLTGLQSDQTYHYRIVAVSSGGTTLGADATFTTGSPAPSTSKLTFFGHTAFVAPQGVGGVFLGCIGGTTCTGKLTISHNGTTIAQRLHFAIGANKGGIVHYTLTGPGRSLQQSNRRLRITVVVTPSSGPAVTGVLTQVPFQ